MLNGFLDRRGALFCGRADRDNGVVPRLVVKLRRALDQLAGDGDIPPRARAQAESYFRNIKIVVSGGFDPRRIERFEREKAPVDIYGVGSFLMHGTKNDFTADVVRVKIAGQWRKMAKAGRQPKANPDMERIQ